MATDQVVYLEKFVDCTWTGLYTAEEPLGGHAAKPPWIRSALPSSAFLLPPPPSSSLLLPPSPSLSPTRSLDHSNRSLTPRVSILPVATVAVPCELSRVLQMMRDVDRKVVDMQHTIESIVGTISTLQAQAAPAQPKARDEQTRTLDSLKATLHENQALLMQWAEEKVQLAIAGYELLAQHQKSLDDDIHNLTQFLSDTGQLEDYMPDDYNGMHADAHMYEPSEPLGARSGRRGSTLRGAGGYTTSTDAYEEEQMPATQSKQMQQQPSQKISLRTNIPLTVPANRQPSSQIYEDPAAADVGNGAGGVAAGAGTAANPNKRRRAAAIANTAAPAQREETRSGRRTAAGQATAALVAAQYDEEEYAVADKKFAAAAAAAQQQAAIQDPALLQPIPLEPFIPGLAESAKKPQAARRRLEEKDIGVGLVGKVAEVFWEDEADASASMWYLVKVESVDLPTKTACVRYQNGEVETNLSLVEAARDGIMLLV